MAFANNKKLKIIAAMVEDQMAYVKGSKSFFSQSEIKGKKYGQKVNGYLPDPGTVKDGIVADPDAINEPEVSAYINNKNTSCETDLWNDLVDIESFKDEIAEPRAKNLALTTQKEVMEENMIRSVQAVVRTTVDFGLLTKSASKLRDLGIGGRFLSFQNPDIMGDIAESGLAKFIPSAEMEKIYGDAYLGRYSGAQQIEIANTPIVDTTGMDAAPTISATVVTDANSNVIGLEPIVTATGSGTGSLIVGAAYKVTGLKIRNAAGIETNNDYVIIWGKEKQGANTVYGIPELRVTSQGKGYNNANAWMDATTLAAAISSGTATFTLTPLLTASKKYAVGQVRTEESLKWDQYRFDSLPGSDDQDVGSFENITLKLMAFGDGKNGVKLLRIDLPYLAKILEPRESVTTYLELP
ncbi:hypothetical protein [uncultured Fibrobacter sp.]|uniref:hypothetical protein n=1 Tax=uncultured Fibrobacter sp. TaxID=261512 RepID=UPI0025E67E12|nr:hypothetical protein [uncultured Fibrobacter sp.]